MMGEHGIFCFILGVWAGVSLQSTGLWCFGPGPKCGDDIGATMGIYSYPYIVYPTYIIYIHIHIHMHAYSQYTYTHTSLSSPFFPVVQ